MNICYNIYKDNPNSPWQATLEAISTALTSSRQKGFDPYAEAKSGPVVNSVSAYAVFTTPNRGQQGLTRRVPNLLATLLEDSRRDLNLPTLLPPRPLAPTLTTAQREHPTPSSQINPHSDVLDAGKLKATHIGFVPNPSVPADPTHHQVK